MTKKKNLSKKGTLEKVQPFATTDQDTQYDVVPTDAVPLSETTGETSKQIIPDEVEANLNVETQPEAPTEIASTVEEPQESKSSLNF